MKIQISILTILLLVMTSCTTKNKTTGPEIDNTDSVAEPFYIGADLSYVNEMIDCGAVYTDGNNQAKDPYQIFSEAGTNLVRLRLWHDPDWTNYSNYEDVKIAIQKAKSQGMKVLLDFHYSDTWADPHHQEVPAAWLDQVNNTEALGDLLYDYTYTTLEDLFNSGLLPEFVQVGNEIRAMILQPDNTIGPMDWDRNAFLINKGIKAVRDLATNKDETIEVMLHVDQPEHGLWWFEQATQNGITDYDWIGLSYYPLWSEYDLSEVGAPLTTLMSTYNKRLMIVETAYPFTLENADPANNILGTDALISAYPASQQGQLDYLIQLKSIVENAGGEGLIYWEPAWVSTDCSTLWGQGSHWDNATLFDHNNKSTLGMSFYNATQYD